MQVDQVHFCDCCGDETEGLLPIFAEKIHDQNVIDCMTPWTWCDECWENGSCKGTCCGCCYKHENEKWWWRCMYCQRLAVPIPKEEPEANFVICEDCNAEVD